MDIGAGEWLLNISYWESLKLPFQAHNQAVTAKYGTKANGVTYWAIKEPMQSVPSFHELISGKANW